MTVQQQSAPLNPDERSAFPSAWKLFWGHLGADPRPNPWSKWIWGSVGLFACGIAAQGFLEGRVSQSVLSGGVFVISCLAMSILYWGTWRYIQEEPDELHRRITVESIVFAFFVTMTLAVGVGTISNFADLPRINLLWVFFIGEPLRGLGLVLAVRKYR